MSSSVWGTPELGTYFLRHAGHDLEIKRIKSSGKGVRERQYQVIVSGTLVDMAWSTTEAKTKAMKAAERTHTGETLVTFEEREAERQERLARFAAEQGQKAEQAAAGETEEASPPADQVEEASDAPEPSPPTIYRPLPIDPQPLPMPQLKEAAVSFRDAMKGRRKAAAPVPCSCAEDSPEAGVSFTIRGNLNMATTDALTTIRAAVELLREHGVIECDAVVPNRVKL